MYVTKLSKHQCILGSRPAFTAVDLSPSKEVTLSWALISQRLMRAQSLTRPPAGDHRTGSGTARNTRGRRQIRGNGHTKTSTKAMDGWINRSMYVSHEGSSLPCSRGLWMCPKLPLRQLRHFEAAKGELLSMRGIKQISPVRTPPWMRGILDKTPTGNYIPMQLAGCLAGVSGVVPLSDGTCSSNRARTTNDVAISG